MSCLHSSTEGDHQLHFLLLPPGQYPGVGRETGQPVTDGIALYEGEFGSRRYVYFVAGAPVSGLQVVSKTRTDALVSNVYTRPDLRRHGFASRLLSAAKRDFPQL